MRRYELRIAGDAFAVEIEALGAREATVVVNGVRYAVAITAGTESAEPRVPLTARAAAPAAPAAGEDVVTAPLPGLVLDVPVAVGDAVTAGDVVVRMEAMKMENDLKTSVSGVVTEVHTKKGDEVPLGQVLVVVGSAPVTRTGCPES